MPYTPYTLYMAALEFPFTYVAKTDLPEIPKTHQILKYFVSVLFEMLQRLVEQSSENRT